MDYPCINAIILVTLVLTSSVFRAKGQINTACSSSMISTFTPCLSYVTGSSANGGSPTEACCNSLKTLMTDNMDCTCLIITGNVPVSIPFLNRYLAISLPRACKTSIPIQCKASGDPLPAPGPALFAPAKAPIASPPHSHAHSPKAPAAAPPHSHAHSPKGSKAATAAAAPPEDETLDLPPASPPVPKSAIAPSANPGIRPVLNPQSASVQSTASLPSLLLILIGLVMVLKF